MGGFKNDSHLPSTHLSNTDYHSNSPSSSTEHRGVDYSLGAATDVAGVGCNGGGGGRGAELGAVNSHEWMQAARVAATAAIAADAERMEGEQAPPSPRLDDVEAAEAEKAAPPLPSVAPAPPDPLPSADTLRINELIAAKEKRRKEMLAEPADSTATSKSSSFKTRSAKRGGESFFRSPQQASETRLINDMIAHKVMLEGKVSRSRKQPSSSPQHKSRLHTV